MKTRAELDTEISINILEELQKANKPEQQPQKLCKHQQRSNALAAFMAKQKQPDSKMVNDLREHYKR